MTRLTACTINTANGGKPKPMAITSRIGTARRRNTGGEGAVALGSEALIIVFVLVLPRIVHDGARHGATAEPSTCLSPPLLQYKCAICAAIQTAAFVEVTTIAVTSETIRLSCE